MTLLPVSAAGGSLVAIGGRLELDNARLFAELHRLSRGRMVVLATASAVPEEVGLDAVEALRSHGIAADLLPVTKTNAARTAFDAGLISRIEATGGVYFTGGDQSALFGALIQSGVETPLLTALRTMHARGGVISGSSAGAAVLPPKMILGGTSMDALVHGLTEDAAVPGLPMGTGLGFFPHGMIDQHFLKRGRIGRLLIGTWAAGYKRGFGVDENTGMICEEGRMWVVGETGVLVVDLSRAKIAPDGSQFDGVLVSYLDDGDGWDFVHNLVIPGPGKRRVNVRKTSFTAPARAWRHVFGSYAFSELMVRLAEADPRVYAEDRATAYDSVNEVEVALTLKRVPRKSKALVLRSDSGARHTMIKFELGVTRQPMSIAEQDRQHAALIGPAVPQELVKPTGRLISLGSTPARGSFELMRELKGELRDPIGIIAVASDDARRTARDLSDLFSEYGMTAIDLGISESSMGSANEDIALIERIRNLGTIVFAGGNQTRLVESLLDRGRETTVLRTVADAYRAGATLVAVSGAASALSRVMIAGGGSYAALRHGIASSGDGGGITVEEGFGLFDLGILDQNLVHRNRLGRLIVACAEEQSRFGFGLCEETGIIVPATGGPIRVFGRHGMAVIEIDHTQVVVQSDSFTAMGLRLWVVRPGESFDPSSRRVTGEPINAESEVGVASLLGGLAKECGCKLVETNVSTLGPRNPVHLRLVAGDGRSAVVDIQSLRTDE